MNHNNFNHNTIKREIIFIYLETNCIKENKRNQKAIRMINITEGTKYENL